MSRLRFTSLNMTELRKKARPFRSCTEPKSPLWGDLEGLKKTLNNRYIKKIKHRENEKTVNCMD